MPNLYRFGHNSLSQFLDKSVCTKYNITIIIAVFPIIYGIQTKLMGCRLYRWQVEKKIGKYNKIDIAK